MDFLDNALDINLPAMLDKPAAEVVNSFKRKPRGYTPGGGDSY